MDLLIMFLVFLGISLVVANLSKERDIGFWTLLAICFIFTPIVALLVALLSKKRNKGFEFMQEPQQEQNNGMFSRFFGKKENKKDDSPPQENLEMPDFGGDKNMKY